MFRLTRWVYCFALLLTINAWIPAHAEADESISIAPLIDEKLDVKSLADQPPGLYQLRRYSIDTTFISEANSTAAFALDHRDLGQLVTTTHTDGKDLVLLDQLESAMNLMTITRMAEVKADTLLSPTKISLTTQRSSSSQTMNATIRRDRIRIKDAQGDTTWQDWPRETLTLSALLRIAPLLSQEPGKSWEVDGFAPLFGFTPTLPSEDSNMMITCVGPEMIRIGRQDYRTTLYRLDLPITDTTTLAHPDQHAVRVWVDQRGMVRQFVVAMELRGTMGLQGPIEDDPVYQAWLEHLHEQLDPESDED